MKKIISIIVILTLVLGIMLANAGVASACEPEGLSPGYWKNHTDAWVDSAYQPIDPDMPVGQLFVIPSQLGLGNYTLLQALNFGGGPGVVGAAKILLRQAVAAYLNASHPDISYYIGAATVRAQTNAALASMDRNTMLSLKDIFDYNNNLGAEGF